MNNGADQYSFKKICNSMKSIQMCFMCKVSLICLIERIVDKVILRAEQVTTAHIIYICLLVLFVLFSFRVSYLLLFLSNEISQHYLTTIIIANL